MNTYGIPIFGWAIGAAFYASMAVPFWFCWTFYGIGEKYFGFLPSQWQSIPFWDCVALFISVSIIKSVFVPSLVSISQKNEVTTKHVEAKKENVASPDK